MAVATPVLERRFERECEEEAENVSAVMTAEERHNAQIRSAYRKLINPDSTVEDIIARDKPVAVQQPVVEVRQTAQPYLVQNARADSDIFRADSIINRRSETAPVAEAVTEEDENEDLRPTQTTIQYKTVGVKSSREEGVVSTTNNEKKIILSKKEKIIIATAIAVIVALFILIIVNSAIISGINTDITYLQSSLTDARAAYSNVNNEVNEYLSNLPETVSNFAESHGMVIG